MLGSLGTSSHGWMVVVTDQEASQLIDLVVLVQ
jgi:hypothetical protein